MRLFGWRGLLGLAVVTTAMTFGVGTASAAFHGIGVTKGCVSPVKINAPYACAVQILNVVDQGHDTVRVTGLSDTVNSAGGPVPSGNILNQIGLVYSGGAVICTGGSGSGTAGSPYVGATSCLLPFGSSITTTGFTHYTVAPADFNLPLHRLTDTASVNWNNTCVSNPDNDCTTLPQTAGAGSSAVVAKLNSSTATDIHNAAHQTVTTVEARSTVHDFVSVTGQPGNPVPSGNVNIDWFLNGECSGVPQSNSGSIGPLNGSGQFDATGFPFTVNNPGFRAFRAHYEGDAVYLPSDGACEPLTVVDANVQITPDGVNHVGTAHVFTGHVNVNNGTGWANAPDGTQIAFFLHSGPGSFTTANPCTISGGAGNCTISLLSNTTGVNVVSAHTIVAAAGLSLTRHSDSVNGNSGVATKRWVDAKIAIAPDATNRIGQPHTFTVTLMKDIGDGAGFIAAGGEHVGVTLTDSNGASSTVNALASTCDDAGANTNASGQCVIVVNSNSAGKVTAHASSTLAVAGSAPFTVQTNGVAPNGADAVKRYVDAKIAIGASATNEVGHAHTFTVTLMKDTGDGLGYAAAAGEHVNFTLTDSNGAVSTLNAASSTCDDAGANTNASGQCTIVFNSNSAGKVTAHASSTLAVSGSAPFTVATDGVSPNSADAVKTFVDANIQISPNGVNRIGDPHTFIAHVNINTGDGSGFVNAPNGTTISFTIDSGPGGFTTTNPCTVAAGGSCQITLGSGVTGVTTVSAHTTLSVGGVSLTRHTNSTGANSGPATKRFVDAKISIAQSATNEVGVPHTFTVTLSKDIGDGTGFAAAAGEHVNFTLTDSNGAVSTLNAASSTCDDAGPNTNASGQCTIVFNSPSAGKVTAHASSTLAVNGSAPFTVATDGVSPNSGDAVKTYVDAKISISPNGVNPVGATHTFTGHVEINTGNGSWVNAPNGTSISFTIDSGPGSFQTATPCATTAGTGSCTIDLKSLVTGTTIVSAHSTLSVGGVSLTRHTNGTGANSSPATKQWVAAKISIAQNATNEVGVPHTFTVTLQKDPGTGYVPAAGEHVSFTLTDSNGASSTLNAALSTCDDAGANTDSSGQCVIVFNSPSAGKVTAHASSTLSVAGSAPITVSTDGVSPNSGDAVKTYVDAKISISPNGVNPVGATHTFTGHVEINTGNGSWVNAPNGTSISFTIDSGPGSFQTATPCATSAGTGSCTIDLKSLVAGTTIVSAHSTLSVGGVSLTRHTNGSGANSSPATKQWVAAKISIAQNATNEVGVPHTFTVTLQKDPGTGYVAAAGEHVSFTLTDSNGAVSTLNAASSTCDDAGANTNASGQCTIVFSSPSAGKVTAHASSTLSVAGSAPITVSTDGVSPNSGDAVKTYVDANIQITPQLQTNPVGINHVFTAHVNVNTGTGGFVNAPNGTQVSFTIDSGPGSFTTANPCTMASGNGSCTITLTSATAGTTVVSAHVTLSVGGVTLTRDTNGSGANSGPATKLWADDTVVTEIRNSSNTVITSAVAGTVVHDRVNVARAAGTPVGVLANPTGNVTFRRYTSTANCTGAHVDQVVALTPGNPATADTSNFTVTGAMSYQADYAGDATYPAHTGACEPLSVITVGPCTLGYPDTSHTPRSSAVFNESEVLRGFSTNGAGGAATISAWYSDEHALTLGVDPDPDGTPVTPMVGTAAQHAANPDIGDITAADGANRPLYPAAFVTDITANTASRAGDWQQQNNNNSAQAPQDLFGTWKNAIKSGGNISPGNDPPQNSTFGPGADTPPANLQYQKYRTEVRWNLSSLKDDSGNPVSAGHAYRILFMVHDGDQNNSGGDVGEACVNLIWP